MRTSELKRVTTETDISVALNLDGSGNYTIDTGVGFFDHMLCLFAKHAQMDLTVSCKGDTQVDAHHTVEDTGIVLGQAIARALGDKARIRRYATKYVPMDEALVRTSLDISGRPYLVFQAEFAAPALGSFDAQLAEEFFRAVAVQAGLTLHITELYGKNTHHIIEAMFKSFAHALREAASVDESLQGVLSTKGVL